MGRKPFVVNRNGAEHKEKKVNSEEFDYMSENVIKVIKEEVKTKQKETNKKKNKLPPVQKSHSSMRDEGLSKPLSSSNIGFKLLQQMGYK